MLVYGPSDSDTRKLINPPKDSAFLRLINYGKPTSSDFQKIEKLHGLTTPPKCDMREGYWSLVVNSAILMDLSHAIYGERKWRETGLFTDVKGKSAEYMRQTAIHLDHNEQTVVNMLGCQIVYMASDAAKLQLADSQTESLCALFDLAINFIIYVAFRLHEEQHSLTSAVFSRFIETHPAYDNGKGLIFQRGTLQAMRFVTTTYRYVVSYDPAVMYYSGHSLHSYMGPRRTFGTMHAHSLRAEFLRELGLSALIKESGGDRLSGPLDELHANFIESGPFKFQMSDHIEDHLTFRLDGRIILYNVNKFDYLVMFRNCIAEYICPILMQLSDLQSTWLT